MAEWSAGEIQAAAQGPVWRAKAEPPAAELDRAACVEQGAEVGLGLMDSGPPAERWSWPQREEWSVAELSAVLVVGPQPWSQMIRLWLLLRSLPPRLLLAPPAFKQRFATWIYTNSRNKHFDCIYYVPVSVQVQPDLSCFVVGWLKSVPSVTAELQLAERGLNWLLDFKPHRAHYYTAWSCFYLNISKYA